MMASTESDEEDVTSRRVLHGRTLISLRDIFRSRQVCIEPNKFVEDLQPTRSRLEKIERVLSQHTIESMKF